jgi:hypothetical protein
VFVMGCVCYGMCLIWDVFVMECVCYGMCLLWDVFVLIFAARL